MKAFDWTPIRYRNVISLLKNRFHAGAYAYGKSVNRTEIVDGRARKTYGHHRPLQKGEILLKDHHEAYIDWEERQTPDQAVRDSISRIKPLLPA